MKKIYLKKTLFITLLVFIIAFFIWRFMRPLNIFVVDEKFARPIHADIPDGLSSVSAKECGE